MPRERQLDGDFKEFMRLVYPAGVGPAQERDLYRCFHAGALCGLQAVVATLARDLSEQDTIEALDALVLEAYNNCRIEFWRESKPQPAKRKGAK